VRYFKPPGSSDEFVQNGASTVRVGRVLVYPSPIAPGRTIRVFEVVQVIRENPSNPVPRGALLALSFPNEHVNADEYEWYVDGAWEECQVPFEIKDRRANLDAASQRRN